MSVILTDMDMPDSCYKCRLKTRCEYAMANGWLGNKRDDNCPLRPYEKRKTEWIPVTERLPEDGERVLATHLGGIDTNRQVIEHIYENGEFTCNWYMDMDITSPTFGQRLMGDIIAWMPLPKPYEGSEKE